MRPNLFGTAVTDDQIVKNLLALDNMVLDGIHTLNNSFQYYSGVSAVDPQLSPTGSAPSTFHLLCAGTARG